MSKLASRRKRRAKKQANSGRAIRPKGAGPGKSSGPDLSGIGRGAGAAFSQLAEHFTGLDPGAIAAAASGHPGAMRGMGFGHRRRMRPTNVKALRRAIRRVDAFGRIAKKVISFTHPRAARGHMVFRRRKRKATV